jgi:hypothetical protein
MQCFFCGLSITAGNIGAVLGRDDQAKTIAGAVTVPLTSSPVAKTLNEPRERTAEMVAARIVLAVAALNLLFLLSELGMNAFRAYFG